MKQNKINSMELITLGSSAKGPGLMLCVAMVQKTRGPPERMFQGEVFSPNASQRQS